MSRTVECNCSGPIEIDRLLSSADEAARIIAASLTPHLAELVTQLRDDLKAPCPWAWATSALAAGLVLEMLFEPVDVPGADDFEAAVRARLRVARCSNALPEWEEIDGRKAGEPCIASLIVPGAP